MTNFWNVTQPRLLAFIETLTEKLTVPFRSLMEAINPPAGPALERRTRKVLAQYDRYIQRRNALAENHERVIAKLNEDIVAIDHEIAELETYSDGLRRILGDL